MVSSDLDVLLDMGFERPRAQIAATKTGGLQGAIDWLEQNQEKSLEEITAQAASDETDPSVEPAPIAAGEEARSLVCNECGKRFRSQEQAQFHASKTEHVDFAESTEEIKPLSKTDLDELRKNLRQKKLADQKAAELEQRQAEQQRAVFRKTAEQARDDLEKQEMAKIVKRKQQEKQDEIVAKARIRAKIAADKQDRQRKIEKERAEREGRPPAPEPAPCQSATTSGHTASKPSSAYTVARLRLQTPGGSINKSFPVDTTLFEVVSVLNQEGIEVKSFTQNFPMKVFDGVDFGSTLKELGLVPSALLIVQ